MRIDLFAVRHTITRFSISPPRKPTLVLDHSAQIFDLTGMARVAVDDGGELDA